MELFLNSRILLMIIIIPTIITFIIQLLLCRYAKSPLICMIPFWLIACTGAALLISCLTGSIQSIIALYLILYALETVSCAILADILAWVIGLMWRGKYIVQQREKQELEESKKALEENQQVLRETNNLSIECAKVPGK